MVAFRKGPSSHKILFSIKPLLYSRKFEMVMLLWITQLHPRLTTSKASSQGPLSLSSSPLPLSALSCIHHAWFYETAELPPHCPADSLGYTQPSVCQWSGTLSHINDEDAEGERRVWQQAQESDCVYRAAMGQHNRSSIQQFNSYWLPGGRHMSGTSHWIWAWDPPLTFFNIWDRLEHLYFSVCNRNHGINPPESQRGAGWLYTISKQHLAQGHMSICNILDVHISKHPHCFRFCFQWSCYDPFKTQDCLFLPWVVQQKKKKKNPTLNEKWDAVNDILRSWCSASFVLLGICVYVYACMWCMCVHMGMGVHVHVYTCV